MKDSEPAASKDVNDLHREGKLSPNDFTKEGTEPFRPDGEGKGNGKDSQAGSAEAQPADSSAIPWPSPVDDAAYYGLAGRIVKAADPHTEADPLAVLGHIIVAFGNVVGRTAHCRVGAEYHPLNEFAVFAGTTSMGRKGTALSRALQFFTDPESKADSWAGYRISKSQADVVGDDEVEGLEPLAPKPQDDDRLAGDPVAYWLARCQQNGLSSGEGLIYAVRNKLTKKEPLKVLTGKDRGKITNYQEVIVDDGVDDKRLLVAEPEFARVLTTASRDKNVLSMVLRAAWDGVALRSMTKSPLHATGAHISLVGHVSKDELAKNITETDALSGFGNRFLFWCVRRSKSLPEGGATWTPPMKALAAQLRETVEIAMKIGTVYRDDEAKALWNEVYDGLNEGKGGLLGAITSRAAPHVLRLSGIYALLDQSWQIRRPHLEAALALWKYAEDSAAFLFGRTMADPDLERLLKFIREAPEGRTRTSISSDLFQRHKPAKAINGYREHLVRTGEIRIKKESTRGRDAERWIAVTTTEPAK